MDDLESIDHAQGGMEVGLHGQMGHDHQWHRAFFGCIVAGVVLDHTGDTNSLLAQNLGEPASTPGRSAIVKWR